MVIAEINRRHDALRESLMRQARKPSSREEAKQIEARVMDGITERRKELREAGKMKWDGVVDWGVEGGDWDDGKKRDSRLRRDV